MKNERIVVVKVGTKVLTTGNTLDKEKVRAIVDQICAAQEKAFRVILVTSGAIGAGMGLLELKKRPQSLEALQAAASIGQGELMHVYGGYFREKGYLVGQILLTQEDFNDRKRYLNIKDTLKTLMTYRAVPIINENDTVSTEEIKFGDNDSLARLVADLMQAQHLILLTDVDGFLDEEGRVIPVVAEITPKIARLARSSRGDLGTGGMATKLEAARKAVASGIACTIANGNVKDVIVRIMSGERVGTTFSTGKARMDAKKRWIAYSVTPQGSITVDEGAEDVLKNRSKSLLASGIVGAEGDFEAGATVRIVSRDGREIGRGICRYPRRSIDRIKGHTTAEIAKILGPDAKGEVIHKDNLVIL